MAQAYPDDLRYTESDEWVRHEDDHVVCGITSFAAEQLGDIVYIQLPETGKQFDQGATFGEIESVKAVSDLFCPVSGEIVQVNEELDKNPGLINEDPYGAGWMVRVRASLPSELAGLMDATAYERHTAERH